MRKSTKTFEVGDIVETAWGSGFRGLGVVVGHGYVSPGTYNIRWIVPPEGDEFWFYEHPCCDIGIGNENLRLVLKGEGQCAV